MNKINRLAQTLFVGAIAIATLALATRAQAENIQQVITVIKVDGGARYSTDGGKTYPTTQLLKKGDVLKQGTVIQTAEKGTVDLLLGEPQAATPTPLSNTSSTRVAVANSGPKANVIHIYPNSVLSIDKLTLDRTGMDEVGETQLDLKAGRILGNVKKLSKDSRYEVKIPNGVAGIRGTTFMIGANGAVYVLSGSVVISYVDSGGTLRTATVMAGQTFQPFNGPNGSAGAGTVSTIPPATLIALQNVYNNTGGPPQTPPTDYTHNGTVVHISPN